MAATIVSGRLSNVDNKSIVRLFKGSKLALKKIGAHKCP